VGTMKVTAGWEEEARKAIWDGLLLGPNGTVYDENGDPVLDPSVLHVKESRKRRSPGMDNIQFTNALRKAATHWSHNMTTAQRSAWQVASRTKSGGRPTVEGPMPNGWDLFAQVALAPLYFKSDPANYATSDNPQPASSITIDQASLDNQTITIKANFAGPPYPDDHSILYVFQIQPLRTRNLSASRFTWCIGQAQLADNGPLIDTWTFPVIFPLRADVQVRCLVRQHLALNGVQNYIVSATPT